MMLLGEEGLWEGGIGKKEKKGEKMRGKKGKREKRRKIGSIRENIFLTPGTEPCPKSILK